jgi:hypothetical protein
MAGQATMTADLALLAAPWDLLVRRQVLLVRRAAQVLQAVPATLGSWVAAPATLVCSALVVVVRQAVRVAGGCEVAAWGGGLVAV